jgi:hypothetical protein
MAVARERRRQLARRRPRSSLVVGEDDVRVPEAAVLAEERGEALSVGRAHEARLAQEEEEQLAGVGRRADQVFPPSSLLL